MKYVLPIGIWLTLSLVNAGFVNADFRLRYADLDQSPSNAAGDQAFAIGWSLLPPMWILTPFVTGFYHAGWTLTREPFPCTTRFPEIWCKP